MWDGTPSSWRDRALITQNRTKSPNSFRSLVFIFNYNTIRIIFHLNRKRYMGQLKEEDERGGKEKEWRVVDRRFGENLGSFELRYTH